MACRRDMDAGSSSNATASDCTCVLSRRSTSEMVAESEADECTVTDTLRGWSVLVLDAEPMEPPVALTAAPELESAASTMLSSPLAS